MMTRRPQSNGALITSTLLLTACLLLALCTCVCRGETNIIEYNEMHTIRLTLESNIISEIAKQGVIINVTNFVLRTKYQLCAVVVGSASSNKKCYTRDEALPIVALSQSKLVFNSRDFALSSLDTNVLTPILIKDAAAQPSMTLNLVLRGATASMSRDVDVNRMIGQSIDSTNEIRRVVVAGSSTPNPVILQRDTLTFKLEGAKFLVKNKQQTVTSCFENSRLEMELWLDFSEYKQYASTSTVRNLSILFSFEDVDAKDIEIYNPKVEIATNIPGVSKDAGSPMPTLSQPDSKHWRLKTTVWKPNLDHYKLTMMLRFPQQCLVAHQYNLVLAYEFELDKKSDGTTIKYDSRVFEPFVEFPDISSITTSLVPSQFNLNEDYKMTVAFYMPPNSRINNLDFVIKLSSPDLLAVISLDKPVSSTKINRIESKSKNRLIITNPQKQVSPQTITITYRFERSRVSNAVQFRVDSSLEMLLRYNGKSKHVHYAPSITVSDGQPPVLPGTCPPIPSDEQMIQRNAWLYGLAVAALLVGILLVLILFVCAMHFCCCLWSRYMRTSHEKVMRADQNVEDASSTRAPLESNQKDASKRKSSDADQMELRELGVTGTADAASHDYLKLFSKSSQTSDAETFAKILTHTTTQRMFKDIDLLDVENAIRADMKNEVEFDEIGNVTAKLLLNRMINNNTLRKDRVDSAIKSFEKKAEALVYQSEKDTRSALKKLEKELKSSNEDMIKRFDKDYKEKLKRILKSLQNLDDRKKMKDLLDKIHEMEKTEAIANAKIANEGERENLRTKQSAKLKLELRKEEKKMFEQIAEENELDSTTAAWMMRQHGRIQNHLDSMYDNYIVRQRGILENRRQERRAMAENKQLTSDHVDELNEAQLSQQQDLVQQLLAGQNVAEERIASELNTLKKNQEKLIESRLKMKKEREKALIKNLSLEKSKMMQEKEAEHLEKMEAFTEKFMQENQMDSVDPLKFLVGSAAVSEANRQELAEFEIQLDRQHAKQLLDLTEQLNAEMKQDLIQMKQTALDNMQKNGINTEDANRILLIHERELAVLTDKQSVAKDESDRKLKERLEKHKANQSQEEANELAVQKSLRSKEQGLAEQLVDLQVTISPDEKERILAEHNKNKLSLENNFAMSRIKQHQLIAESLAARKANNLQNLQFEQSKETAKNREQSELSDPDENVDADLLLKHADEQLKMLNDTFTTSTMNEEKLLRDRMLMERQRAHLEMDEKIAELLISMQMEKTKEMVKIEEQANKIKQLKAGLLNTLASKGGVNDDELNRIMSKHEKRQEAMRQSIEDKRQNQMNDIQKRLQAKKARSEAVSDKSSFQQKADQEQAMNMEKQRMINQVELESAIELVKHVGLDKNAIKSTFQHLFPEKSDDEIDRLIAQSTAQIDVSEAQPEQEVSQESQQNLDTLINNLDKIAEASFTDTVAITKLVHQFSTKMKTKKKKKEKKRSSVIPETQGDSEFNEFGALIPKPLAEPQPPPSQPTGMPAVEETAPSNEATADAEDEAERKRRKKEKRRKKREAEEAAAEASRINVAAEHEDAAENEATE